MGFDAILIDSKLRVTVNRAFRDLASPFASGAWDEATTLGGMTNDILDKTDYDTIPKYRAHALELIKEAFNAAAGADADGVPVAQRPEVRDSLNESLRYLLIRNATLADLAGNRQGIVESVAARMIV